MPNVTSAMGKLRDAAKSAKDVVTGKKFKELKKKREELKKCIEDSAAVIDKYYNSLNNVTFKVHGVRLGLLSDKMAKYWNEIDALRTRKSRKSAKVNLVKDIDVDSYYRSKTIDNAIKTIKEVKKVISGENEAVEKTIEKNKKTIEDYFNKFQGYEDKMSKADIGRLKNIYKLMGKEQPELPLVLDEKSVVGNSRCSAVTKIEILESTVDYIGRAIKNTNNAVKRIIAQSGKMLENYFNKFEGKENEMGTFSEGHLKRINALMENEMVVKLPLELDAEKIVSNDKFRAGLKVEILENAVAYVGRVIKRQKNKE